MQLDMFLQQQVRAGEDNVSTLQTRRRAEIVRRIAHVNDLVPRLRINQLLEFLALAEVGLAGESAIVGVLVEAVKAGDVETALGVEMGGVCKDLCEHSF